MSRGIVFDIQEFSVNDGPGLRVTVFLKGCPLRCKWCHNPEGLSFEPQRNLKTGQMVGREWSSDALAAHLLSFKDAFDLSGGGVTFSGGEATVQFEFLLETMSLLKRSGIHVNLDTSGYCDHAKFIRLLEFVDLVYFDVKCVDSSLHERMTGKGNALILSNLDALAQSKVPYHVRVPLVPNVSDTADNRVAMEALLAALPRQPEEVDWLPFNEMAAAKYENYAMEYLFK